MYMGNIYEEIYMEIYRKYVYGEKFMKKYI